MRQREELRALGIRVTPQRQAILEVLEQAQRHLTPQEIFQRVQARLPGITEATVYRTLDFFARRGLVLASYWPDRGRVYERAAHHHHLVCSQCGQALEIAHETLAPLYHLLEKTTGYRLLQTHLTFQGLCPTCQEE